MSSTYSPFPYDLAPRRTTSELIKTHAERLALEEHERAQQKRLELEEQRSDENPPDVRIRPWEKVHRLRMPSDAMHTILDVIAGRSRLTLPQAQGEHRRRVAE